MPETKDIICLANSWKHGGRCVAGVELNAEGPGDWIRPISNRSGHGLYPSEIRLDGNKDPEVLDIIRLELGVRTGEEFQSENWTLADHPWRKVGAWARTGVLELIDDPRDLWGVGDSSQKGMNDRISGPNLAEATTSLALIRPEALKLRVLDGGFMEIKREVRAIFEYRGELYNLKVTDPVVCAEHLGRPDGIYETPGYCLTISLAEMFEGFSYKVVAALVPFQER